MLILKVFRCIRNCALYRASVAGVCAPAPEGNSVAGQLGTPEESWASFPGPGPCQVFPSATASDRGAAGAKLLLGIGAGCERARALGVPRGALETPRRKRPPLIPAGRPPAQTHWVPLSPARPHDGPQDFKGTNWSLWFLLPNGKK